MGTMNMEYRMFLVANGWNSRLKAATALSGIEERDKEQLQRGKELCNNILTIANSIERKEKIKRDFALALALQKIQEREQIEIHEIIARINTTKEAIEHLLEGKSISKKENDEAIKLFDLFIKMLDEELKNNRGDISRFMSVKV